MHKTPINPAVLEEDEPLTEADIAKIRLESMQLANPMLTMQDGTKRVACTECHQRPLKVARLCQECHDERMRIADWKAKLNIVRRGKGKPKLTCPWCGHTERDRIEGGLNDSCCGSMRIAMREIYLEEADYQRAADHFEIPGGL